MLVFFLANTSSEKGSENSHCCKTCQHCGILLHRGKSQYSAAVSGIHGRGKIKYSVIFVMLK